MAEGSKRRKSSELPRGIESFLENFGVELQELSLLRLALTHRSWAEEVGTSGEDNQRLEFLGDAVLELVVTEALYGSFPAASEGRLSRLRQQLISTGTLAEVSRAVSLGDWVRLGRGEALSGGRDRERLLADLFEAITGAIYLSGGMETARAWVMQMLGGRIAQMDARRTGVDSKTALQEEVQGRLKERPVYEIVEVRGPAHEQVFVVEVLVAGVSRGRGEGPSRRAAEQAAAEVALEALTE